MESGIEIGPSLLAADILSLGDEIDAVASADYLHVDVMDGHFASDFSWGPAMVRRIVERSSIPVELHLMVEDCERWCPRYVDAGPARIMLHVECADDDTLLRLIDLAHAGGCEAGVVLGPDCSPPRLARFAGRVEEVMVMGVRPGCGGSRMLEDTPQRIALAAEWAARHEGCDRVPVGVDGGVKMGNVGALARAGATRFVAGTQVFATVNRAEAIAALRSAAVAGARGRR